MSLENDIKVLIATPTALLAMRYQNTFDEDIVSETVYSTFFYPVDAQTKATINWNLSSYDFIFVDEVSMLPYEYCNMLSKVYHNFRYDL